MHATSETIKLETRIPEFCFRIEQNRFEQINVNPQKYSEFINSLEMEIFENEPLSTEDEMEFIAQIDYVLNTNGEFKLPSEFAGKQIMVKKENGSICVLSLKKTEVTVPCREYHS